MSLSESFEREVRILCFSSTIARCDDTDEDLVEGGGVGVGVVWLWGFEFFIWVGLELEEEERMRMEAPHKVNECCLQCNGGATLLAWLEWSGM